MVFNQDATTIAITLQEPWGHRGRAETQNKVEYANPMQC